MDYFKPEVPLESCLEALLFVASGPVSIAQLAVALDSDPADIEAGLHVLENRYIQSSGLRLQWHMGRVQLTTSPQVTTSVEKFLGMENTTHLSRASLETLAIVAYQQPITRPQVDGIRGVNSDGVLKSLLSKGLIQDIGRGDGPGRPILYGTTPDFLRHFGLSSIRELPPLDGHDSFQPAAVVPGEILKD